LNTPVCSITASNGSTPEWLATTSAGPEAGTCSRPRIRTRNQFRYRTPATGISTLELNSGSKPVSSAWESPLTRRST
jgi:hypothetical protein